MRIPSPVHIQKKKVPLRTILRMCCLIVLMGWQPVVSQILPGITLFPDTSFIPSFPADAHAHRMNVENIALTRNIRSSMGSTLPFFGMNVDNIEAQASLGASVHFELHPIGQAHIVSNDYYVDFLILDVLFTKNQYIRFVTGHTSHHLSDNWFERLKLTTAVRYSRDYIKLLYIYDDDSNRLYAGADYAYIFTIGSRIARPWTFQAGGEMTFGRMMTPVDVYCAFDSKFREEAKFAATMTYQMGIKMTMQNRRPVRLAYQFRHGLDDRGQFFPQHRTISTIGLYFDL